MTGGAGFLGSHLCRLLLQDNKDVGSWYNQYAWIGKARDCTNSSGLYEREASGNPKEFTMLGLIDGLFDTIAYFKKVLAT